MTMKAESADGVIHEFPDGTAPDVIDQAMKSYASSLPKPAGRLERLGTGFMDPIYGAAQIGARSREPSAFDPPGFQEGQIEAVDKIVREREKEIQSRRPAADRGSIDWYRAAGSIPSTAVFTAPLALGGVGGAVVGGVAGGAMQPVAEGDFGTEKAKQMAEGGVIGGVFGVAGKLVGAGLRSLGSYIAREYPENVMTQAVNKVLKRLGQDQPAGGPTAQQALDLINEAEAAGKPLRMADVGGENVRALAGNVARQPGEARNVAQSFLTQRDEGSAKRLGADISRYVHGGDSMHRTTEALLEARSAEAAPVWNHVREMQGVWSPRLQEFINDPSLRAGMARGYEIERLESLAAGRKFDPTQMGIDLDAEGNILIRQHPNMRVIHMGKMGLDAMIADERNEITGRLSARGVALDKVRQAYVAEVDGLDKTGLYRQARALWEGPAAAMDAMRTGRAVFQSSPDEIAAEFSRLSPANQEFYRLGVADKVRERLARTGLTGDEARSIMGNAWTRDQLRPVFRSPEDFNAFVKAVTTEARMFGTMTKVIKGPATAERLAEDTSAENTLSAGAMDLGERVATGHWMSAARTAVRMWRDREDRRGNPRLNEQVARILFGPIEEGSEIAQRLTGTFKGPKEINRLAPAADIAPIAGSALAPGAGSAIAQPTGLTQ